ncbi:M15 family metallopeptidase [Synechococcus sp. HB1133]|uniref:M15 family metallopeptidase n=1 Tax=unclassified Synechococcus TaxID=2626047 RepID=UPI00140C0C56|nr:MULTISPECIES: M15 family metallopeptidase [unclassified Synechococcus]MCB4394616.1 M15 family metallopeptidase [Synechococcus sp. PH41509]MCB4423560.1 M15 family metallopeptidase [Synechococcus sp. HB1133]MCB4431818.1 M15 family metallopeptidase [Synechococcus sp. HBA1120]NHI82507.1 D-alanyl-D-alanine dipeptidase [Synechococcus sp. HB1133]
MRPWSPIPIEECGEPLQDLPREFLRMEPHPYMALGAPYGASGNPFQLRQGVVQRLLKAQQRLSDHDPSLRLSIFDAWRPIAVQAFMVEHSIADLCRERGVELMSGDAFDRVVADVGRFWAAPSRDPATPPPHSTGAAVDLTLSSREGIPLEMGGEIDAIGAISEPEHYAGQEDPDARCWHQRRQLLADVMDASGFAQHPNEWWHYSFGDQLWAWRKGAAVAVYAEAANSALTS